MATTTNNENNTADKVLTNICDPGSLIVYDRSNDPFGSENNGTAKFIGGVGSGGGNDGGGFASSSGKFDFHTIKAASNNQRTIRSDIPKNELIKMLCFMEGELQARDIVIAALRNERVKQFLTQLCSKPMQLSDPRAALFRDKLALSGNLASRETSSAAVQAEMEVRAIIEQQMESLYQMVTKQRSTQVRMVNILTESLENNQRMRQELEEEKRKHEHDTAQGDDITYGLEMERTKLKQELETERTQRKKLEKDLKKLQETSDLERTREKQIVLYLIAERKRILMKYIEEGKRSEDLAQILSEEKQRSDTIAEGLEEESKKSLRMEADMEKQTVTYDNERKAIKLKIANDEKRIKDYEAELALLKMEIDTLKKQNSVTMRMQASHNVPVPALPAKSRSITGDDSGGAPSSMVNVAKIVQPTATISSVPVSGPTTGIARSISPGQSLRQQAHVLTNDTSSSSGVSFSAPPAKITPRKPSPLTNLTASSSSNSNNPLIGGDDDRNPMSLQSSLPSSPLLISSPQSSPIPNHSHQSQKAPSFTTVVANDVSSSQSPSHPPSSLATTVQMIETFDLAELILPSENATTLGNISSSQVVHSQQQQLVNNLSSLSSTSTILRSATSAASSIASAVVSGASIANSTILPLSSSSSITSNTTAPVYSPITSSAVNNINSAAIPATSTPSPATAAPPTAAPPTAATTTPTVVRGVPPPIPPNKPVVPPKREPSISRLGSITANNSK